METTSSSTMEEARGVGAAGPAGRSRGRRRRRRAMMLMMPVMMVAPIALFIALWRGLRRIERKLDALTVASGAERNRSI